MDNVTYYFMDIKMKPIAWIHPSDLEKLPHKDCWVNGQPSKGDIPLYTEPQYRELSDEEIKSEAKYFCHSWFMQNPERLVLFAHAILKKASEK